MSAATAGAPWIAVAAMPASKALLIFDLPNFGFASAKVVVAVANMATAPDARFTQSGEVKDVLDGVLFRQRDGMASRQKNPGL